MQPTTIAKSSLTADPKDRTAIEHELRSAAASLGGLVTQRLGDEADVYVVGLNYDFDVFARRYAVSLGDRLVGVACYSSEVMRYPTDTGERLFVNRMNYTETPVRPPTVAVVFMAVASDEIEILNLISLISDEIGSAKVIVACALAASGIGDAAAPWLEEYNLPKPEIVALQTSEGDLRNVRDKTYETLDDRPRKVTAMMPIWIMERAFGPMPEHMREKYALRD